MILHALLIVACLLAACALPWNLSQRRQRRVVQALNRDLLLGLELMQGVQRHRALGGQTGQDAERDRQCLELQLERSWQAWPDADHQRAWRSLLQAPADFEGHCRLLESLLARIRFLELHMCRLLQRTPGIADRCWQVEDLGRLRGLSIRAAALPECPLELRIQLQYLHDRLLGSADTELREALAQLARNLFSTRSLALQPAQLYALFTPLIDKRIEALRSSLD
ncbi:hypothetical protein E8F20_25025 [Pseudomonas sp. BN415]|uniref:hypothetical protein n=1 Tax=Pseudomonas sp. BN415 TaxID=2567889 RepID=UPI0024572510|nr:hypothetical protein [Pseudomonas sp. BN415]MDH4585130.1 hypothetical protein [Pseudomonas sp. BN415]